MKKALNVACGSNVIQSTEEVQWINADMVERENELDMIVDITKKFPFEKESLDYIYCEQFIEHLNWLEGKKFLINCFKSLKKGGKLRLVLPHYRKIFQKYIDKDHEFFKVFFKGLNEDDLPYYTRVYDRPERVKKERKDNPPPRWHTSPRLKYRDRLKLRVRRYRFPIDIVDWFVHQYREHRCLYDADSLEGYLIGIGFSKFNETERKEIDSDAPTRITSSLYVEIVK